MKKNNLFSEIIKITLSLSKGYFIYIYQSSPPFLPPLQAWRGGSEEVRKQKTGLRRPCFFESIVK